MQHIGLNSGEIIKEKVHSFKSIIFLSELNFNISIVQFNIIYT